MQITKLSKPSIRQLLSISSIHKQVLKDSVLSTLPPSIIAFVYLVLNYTTPSSLIICTNTVNNIVGFALVYSSSCWPQLTHPQHTGPELQFIAIGQEYQHQGLGRKILNFINNMLYSLHQERMIVGTKSKNNNSNEFYKHLGFKFMGKTIIFGDEQNFYQLAIHPQPK
jgi:ribosomal protein S18 acetylase RimI-like enzyme